MAASNNKGTGPASALVAVVPIAPVALGAFRGNIVLGSPTNTSVKANVFASNQSGTVTLSYGAVPGVYDRTTSGYTLTAGTPVEVPISGLTPNKKPFSPSLEGS